MTKEQALNRIARYCVGAERCTSDIKRKLRQWEVDDALHSEIIAYLISEHYVDEERYALAFARDKQRFSLWGARRIVQELRAKQIPQAFIEKALEGLEDDIEQTNALHALLNKKHRTLPASLDYRKSYERLVRYGLYRGYEYEDVVRIARDLLGQNCDD